jgi:hypothetical protein
LKKAKHAALFPYPRGLPRDNRCGLTIRALWTGVVYGRNWTPCSRDAQPGMFAFLTFGNLVGIFICLWLAAGYTLEDFLAPVGLSGLFR